MAKLYSQERSKYGNLTGQIITWPVEISPDINAISNREKLPSGYLRCDGGIYNVVDYPQLASICGVGTAGKFVRKNLAGEAIQSLTDNQFVVPDLSSKYPKPSPGADAGVYKSIREVNAVNNEVSRSGIGIEATSTLGTSIQVTYTGTFTVPSQPIELRGRPSWTWGTTSGRQTESEVVDASAIAGHMHFGSVKRSRLKATNETDTTAPAIVKDPQAAGLVSYWNASTVPIYDWLDNTVASGTSSFPGNSQEPCKAMVSRLAASHFEFKWGAFSGIFVPGVGNPVAYSNACWNDGDQLFTSWKYNCLLPPAQGGNGTDGWVNYPISTSQSAYALDNMRVSSTSGLFFLFVCGIANTNQPQTYSTTLPANYVQGGDGVPLDWKSASLHDVVPLNSNLNSGTTRIYADLLNEMNETQDLVQSGGDPTSHFHKVVLDRGTHSFKYVTDALDLNPDALKTTLNLSVDNAVSVDSVVSPFIVLEYLIKI